MVAVAPTSENPTNHEFFPFRFEFRVAVALFYFSSLLASAHVRKLKTSPQYVLLILSLGILFNFLLLSSQ